MPNFMMIYRRGRSKHEFEQIIDCRNGHVAAKIVRRFVIDNIRHGRRVKVTCLDELIDLEPLSLPTRPHEIGDSAVPLTVAT
jgi:hypothetical protein